MVKLLFWMPKSLHYPSPLTQLKIDAIQIPNSPLNLCITGGLAS